MALPARTVIPAHRPCRRFATAVRRLRNFSALCLAGHARRRLQIAGTAVAFAVVLATTLRAEVPDPQLRTDHPWYPGELALSTFERLFATQAEQYRRATGKAPATDEDRALASWFFRNTHYAHGEEGAHDWWGKGFQGGGDLRNREYWTGLFAHGFGLCGTTHSQWSAEMEFLLGHGRGRGVGAAGHNAFEVWLTGGAYGAGKWALLDHDLSTVIFDTGGAALLGLAEVRRDWKQLTDRKFAPDRQRGWLVCGLHPGDGASYASYNVAEYLPGYAGPPPMLRVRRGETLRRYFAPGLEDGKTFVFWGRNYNAAGISGPERAQTWVNQPEKMHGSKEGTPFKAGQARYGNAVSTYRPDFASGDYREGVVDESAEHVTFGFRTPYVIGATPPDNSAWGIYKDGGRNGLVLRGKVTGKVSVSVDDGGSWKDAGEFRDGLDLTDFVKGRQSYQLRLHAAAKSLANSGLVITTVCQLNPAMLPRLHDDGAQITFAASGRGVVSAGPTKPEAQTHVVAGAFDSPTVTLALRVPTGRVPRQVFAAAHTATGNPPRPELKSHIEFSTDGGKSWRPVVKDWQIPRRGDEPKDFWSQSFAYGSTELTAGKFDTVQVRFRNDGGKRYLRAEAHLVHEAEQLDATKVTFSWTDARGPHTTSRTVGKGESWKLPAGKNVQTKWVEFEAMLNR
jgi:hypothetical protein